MHEVIKERCELILESIEYIESYFKDVVSPDNFHKKENGRMLLDAIMMRLQVIGENIKKINSINHEFFSDQIHFDTSIVVRFRDFISHHYEKLDSDIVYEICISHIPLLKEKITNFLTGI